jgi:hypothetical protein
LPLEVINDYLERCDFLSEHQFGETSAYLILAGSCYESIVQNMVAVDERQNIENVLSHTWKLGIQAA